MVMMFVNGQIQPISSMMQDYFCSKKIADGMLSRVIALCPNAALSDDTKHQPIQFIVDENDDIRFWEIKGIINPEANALLLSENAGLLAVREKDRSIYSGGNIDHPSGDDLVIRSATWGYVELGWGQ